MADQRHWIPDRRLLMPELFEPGRKPSGPVQIDGENPLAEGLVFAGVATPVGLFDLVRNRLVPPLSGAAQTYESKVQNVGWLPDADGDGWNIEWDLGLSNKHSQTYIGYIGNANSNYISDGRNSDPGASYWWISWTGRIEYAGVGPGSGGESADTYTPATVTANSADNELNLYSKEKKIYSGACSNANIRAGHVIASRNTGAQPTDGVVFLFLIHDRILSEIEVRQLHYDPYQILKSAIDVPLALYSAGAPPSGGIAPLHFHHRHHNMAG